MIAKSCRGEGPQNLRHKGGSSIRGAFSFQRLNRTVVLDRRWRNDRRENSAFPAISIYTPVFFFMAIDH